MSKQKFPHAEAAEVAKALFGQLSNYAATTPAHMNWPNPRLFVVAGSLRRQKQQVSDIEFLYVPLMEERMVDMFTSKPMDLMTERINQLVADGILAKRPNIRDQFTWGEQNKLAIHVASGIPVDFFATTPQKWWVSLVIRTGSKETNLRLTTGANAQNATLNAYGEGVTWSDGSVTPATSEQHVFEMCRVPYVEAAKR